MPNICNIYHNCIYGILVDQTYGFFDYVRILIVIQSINAACMHILVHMDDSLSYTKLEISRENNHLSLSTVVHNSRIDPKKWCPKFWRVQNPP